MHNLRCNYTHLIRVCVDISTESGIAFIASKLGQSTKFALHPGGGTVMLENKQIANPGFGLSSMYVYIYEYV